KDLDASLEIGELDLAWWKNAQLSNVSLKTKDGVEMARIESAEVEAPLWSLLWGKTREFELKINRPVFQYTIDSYGKTNWDRIFPAQQNKPKSGSSWGSFRHQSSPLKIRIIDGEFLVHDQVLDHTLRAHHIEIALQKSQELISGTLAAETEIAAQNGSASPASAGQVEAEFQLAMADDEVVGGVVDGELKKTPLQLIQPWLKQFAPQLNVSAGEADGTIETRWSGSLQEGFKLALQGALKTSFLKVSSKEDPAGRELHLDNFEAQLSIDNTLPTAPGKYELKCSGDRCVLKPVEDRPENDPLRDDPFEAVPRTIPVPVIPLGKIQLNSRGTVAAGGSAIQFDATTFQTETATLNISGTISRHPEGKLLDLEGTGQGDFAPLLFAFVPELTPRFAFKRLTPEDFAVEGVWKAEKPAEVNVPIDEESPPNPFEEEKGAAAPELKAVANWTWQEFSAEGVTSNSGKLWSRYERNEIKLVPTGVKIGERGSYQGVCLVSLQENNRFLAFEPGLILKDVEFTESMCRGWLQYVNPVFANATDLEGIFSLKLQDFLLDLQTGHPVKLQGELDIDSCRLGPGPAVVKFLEPLSQARRLAKPDKSLGAFEEGAKWLELPEQTVGFARKDNRIYHDRFQFNSGKVTVVSTGSVGLDADRSLDIGLQVPLDLLPNKSGPFAEFLRNQPLEIRVQGTLNEPRVEGTALKQFGAGAVENLLKGLFDKRREK
ncbi:MAG: hypothetical protein KDA78_04020, partial [Planctomycetaceae bacterium]|nr:hypothetical protein [Planctomycetaceae bacterium]